MKRKAKQAVEKPEKPEKQEPPIFYFTRIRNQTVRVKMPQAQRGEYDLARDEGDK